jgi:hypothetical protein
MKNNNQDHQYLNAALLWKILRFIICLGVGLQISLIGESQWSSRSSASAVSQPKTVPNQQNVLQSDRSLLLSQVIKLFSTSGRGSLEVSNGTDNDAYIKLIDHLSRTLVASFYVQSNSIYTLEGIPDGEYDLLFVTGQGWNSSTGLFSEAQSFSKFDLPFEFTTTQLYDSIRYKIHKVTLHTVPEGNAPTNTVSEEEFNQY